MEGKNKELYEKLHSYDNMVNELKEKKKMIKNQYSNLKRDYEKQKIESEIPSPIHIPKKEPSIVEGVPISPYHENPQMYPYEYQYSQSPTNYPPSPTNYPHSPSNYQPSPTNYPPPINQYLSPNLYGNNPNMYQQSPLLQPQLSQLSPQLLPNNINESQQLNDDNNDLNTSGIKRVKHQETQADISEEKKDKIIQVNKNDNENEHPNVSDDKHHHKHHHHHKQHIKQYEEEKPKQQYHQHPSHNNHLQHHISKKEPHSFDDEEGYFSDSEFVLHTSQDNQKSKPKPKPEPKIREIVKINNNDQVYNIIYRYF